MEQLLLCPWETAKYFVYSSNIPTLFFYSHIPAVFIALLVGLLVFYKSNKSKLGISLLIISLIFSAWCVFDLILWATNKPDIVMFFWSLQVLFESLVYLVCFYLVYLFIKNKDLPFCGKMVLLLLYSPIILLLSSKYNLQGVNLANCTAVEGFIAQYFTYIVESIIILSVIFLTIFEYRKISIPARKKEIVVFSLGIVLFLIAFSSGNIIGSFTENWTLAQTGLIGMPILIGFLTYLIVQFHAFNTKLLAVQAFVWGLAIVTGSQFFFIKVPINFLLTGITFVAVIIIGDLFNKSFKKEIKQRMEIEHLLKIKSEFIGVVSHQLRTPVSVIKGMASMLKEGDLDNEPKEKRDIFIAGIYEKSEKLADILDDILKAEELDMDNFAFLPASIKTVNLSPIIKGIFDDLASLAEKKKLNYKINIDPEVANLNLMTDSLFLRHVFQNIIDNAIKYSKEGGSVTVDLGRNGEYFICKIIDSGIGVPEDQKDRLFEKFFRAKNAVDAYAYGTGLGLFISRKIVEAHPDGKIWLESEVNKGTTFFIKLPIAK